MRLDAHVHVFHPESRLRPQRRYAPTYSATPTNLLAQLDANSVHGALLVQPSFLADHDDLLQALAAHPDRFRGVTSPASLMELQAGWDRWRDHQVAGVRLNLVGRDAPDLGDREWGQIGRAMAEAGMHLEIHARGHEWERLAPALSEWPADVVIDHIGRTLDVVTMLRLGEQENVWFKVSAPYRWPDVGAGGSFVNDLADRTGGERLLWGSDWPFTQHESSVDYASMLAVPSKNYPVVAAKADGNLQRLLGQRAFD